MKAKNSKNISAFHIAIKIGCYKSINILFVISDLKPVDPLKIKIFGPGTETAMIDTPTHFLIDTSGKILFHLFILITTIYKTNSYYLGGGDWA